MTSRRRDTEARSALSTTTHYAYTQAPPALRYCNVISAATLDIYILWHTTHSLRYIVMDNKERTTQIDNGSAMFGQNCSKWCSTIMQCRNNCDIIHRMHIFEWDTMSAWLEVCITPYQKLNNAYIIVTGCFCDHSSVEHHFILVTPSNLAILFHIEFSTCSWVTDWNRRWISD